MNRTDILTIVQEINNSHVKNKAIHFAEQYADFKKAYPNLYEMACKGISNISVLEFMLDLMEKVHNNETTTHDASVEVGQRLFDQYVSPRLPDAKEK